MRRKQDPFDKPWVIIAAVVGIIAVLIIALAFFMNGGLGGSAASSAKPASSSATTEPTIVVGVAPSVIKTQVPVTLPAEGVFVRVSYIGSFSGRYGMVNDLQTVRNSGDRVFVIDNATGTILADFHKEDSSSRHDLTVEIWKDGKAQKTATNTSGYGEVNITYAV